MADDFIQVAPDSTGKKVDNTSVTTGAGTVHRQTASLGDPGTALRARVLDADPPTDTPGIAVRIVGTIAVEPMAHASSHAVAGSDPVTIAESQVTGLVADLAALAASSGWTVISNADVGAINDWAPAGLSGNTLILWNGASDFAPTGIAGGVLGQLVTVKNLSTTKIVSFPDTGASLAAAQFKNFVTGGPTPIAARGQITYQHDGTNWKIVGHEQGAWITRPFAAGNFFGQAGQTWTVASGGVITDAYRLAGRTLTYSFDIQGSVGGTPGVLITITLPNGLGSSKIQLFPCIIVSGGVQAAGYCYSSGAGNTGLNIAPTSSGSGNWSAGANIVYGTVAIEVS